jgi:cytochrome P450
VPEDYSLSTPQLDDPYPYYRSLRDEDPVHFSEREDLYVVSRFEDCMAVFADWQTWSSERRGNLVNDPRGRIGKTLGTTDPPRHTVARKLVSKAFTARRITELEPVVREHARELAEDATATSRFEFVHSIAAPLNAGILGTLFGMTAEQILEMRPALDDFFTREVPSDDSQPAHIVAMATLRTFLEGLVDKRQHAPGGDLVSAMIAAEDEGARLQHEQVVVTTMTFLTAGFESANNLLTNMANALSVVPDLFRTLRAEPALVPAFVEETMRWDAAAQGFVRSPNRDVVLHGRTIPAGAQVLVHIGSANRDERQFEQADDFRLQRPMRRHLGLGHGPHFCIGAPLGRLLARVSFEELLPRVDNWHAEVASARRVTTPNFRGFLRLEIEQ